MSQDVLNQVADEIRASKARISLQLDESTDVSNCAYLLVYCRYEHAGELKEEFLMCESLETTSKGVDVLEKMDNFFQQNNISWNHVGSLCTDRGFSLLPFYARCQVRLYNSGEKTRTAHYIYSLCTS